MASENGHTEVVSVLLGRGADNNVRDKVSDRCLLRCDICRICKSLHDLT